MTGIEWMALWLAWVLAGGSPGPATLSIAGTAMNGGRRAGLTVACGILLGSAFWGAAAAAGLGAVMAANAWLFEVLRYLGAGYLLFLAARSLRSALGPVSAVKERVVTGSPRRLLAKGALIHLTNPKAILSWGSVYAVVLPAGSDLGDVFGLFAFLFTGSLLVFPGYAVLFSSPVIVAGYKRLRSGFELVFAGFFGFASLKILTARLQ